jgi:hypothetical protein
MSMYRGGFARKQMVESMERTALEMIFGFWWAVPQRP